MLLALYRSFLSFLFEFIFFCLSKPVTQTHKYSGQLNFLWILIESWFLKFFRRNDAKTKNTKESPAEQSSLRNTFVPGACKNCNSSFSERWQHHQISDNFLLRSIKIMWNCAGCKTSLDFCIFQNESFKIHQDFSTNRDGNTMNRALKNEAHFSHFPPIIRDCLKKLRPFEGVSEVGF